MPATSVTLRFPALPADEDYRLLELPAEILRQVEAGAALP